MFQRKNQSEAIVLAPENFTSLKITEPPAHPLQKAHTISVPAPRSIIQRNPRQEEKKQNSSAEPVSALSETKINVTELAKRFWGIRGTHFIKRLSVSQQKKLLKKKLLKDNLSKRFTLSRRIFSAATQDNNDCLAYINGLKTETLASLKTIDQIELLQLSVERTPEIFATLIEKMPYHLFKNAFKSHSYRHDRRTAYHDAAQCLAPDAFLNLIRESHTSDPKAFFRMLHKQDIDGRTVLHLAAQYQPADVFLELLSRIVKYKDYQHLLMMQSHDHWDLLFLVARYQTADNFTCLLSCLPDDYILQRATDHQPCSLLATVAPDDRMLTLLSKILGESTFLHLLNKAINAEKTYENPLITAMHSAKSFLFLSTRFEKSSLIIALTTRLELYFNLLMIFLQSAAASEQLSLGILHLHQKHNRKISYLLDNDAIFAAVLCRQSAKVIAAFLNQLEPDEAKRHVLSACQLLLRKPDTTVQEKIEFVAKLDLHILLDSGIFAFLCDVIEPPSFLKDLITQSLFAIHDNGNCRFHEDILNEQPKTLISSITQLAEVKDHEGLVNTAMTIFNPEGETPLHAALKRNPSVALHLIHTASKKSLHVCYNDSKENLLVLAVHSSISCFIQLIEKLEITHEETLLKQVSAETITDILFKIQIEKLLSIIAHKSPRILYDLFMQKERRAITFHRLIAESGSATSIATLFEKIVKLETTSYFNEILLVRNKQGITLLEQLAKLPFDHLPDLLEKQDVILVSQIVLEIIEDMLNRTQGENVISVARPNNILPYFFETASSDTLNKLCRSHHPLTINLLELLLDSHLRWQHLHECLLTLFKKISEKNMENLLTTLTARSFINLINTINESKPLQESIRGSFIQNLINQTIFDPNQRVITPDNVSWILEYLRRALDENEFKIIACDLLARIAAHCETHQQPFPTADYIFDAHFKNHPDLICDFLNTISISTFDYFLKNLSDNNVVVLFFITNKTPHLHERKLDQCVLNFIERMPVKYNPEQKYIPQSLRAYATTTDTQYWQLLKPYLASPTILQLIEICSDNLMIALAVNAKDIFLANIEERNTQKWNVMHSLLYRRNSKTVLAILTQFNARDWEKIDAILAKQEDSGETSLHTACFRDEKVFALFVKNSSFKALREAACKETFAHQETVLEFALPKQTPSVIAALLVKMDYLALIRLLAKESPHDNTKSRLYFQLACYVIHEPSWQTTEVLDCLFHDKANLYFMTLDLLEHIKRVPSDRIPHAVIRRLLPLLTDGRDSHIRNEWRIRIAPLPDDVPLKALAHARRNSFFLPVNSDEAKSHPYAEQMNHINELIKNNHLAIKIINGEENWNDFLIQLTDYNYRPKLRVKMDKTQPVYKFFHLEKEEDKKIRQYEYKQKSDFQATKKQSVSFIPRTLGTPVFGEQHVDRELVGVLIDFKIEDIHAMFIRDKGTYQRGWVHQSREIVERYQRAISEFNCTDFAEFCKAVESHPERLNEMLLKLTRESIKAIVLVKDTPMARKIAAQRQVELKKAVKLDVPIVYYDRLQRAMRPLKMEGYAFEQKLKI